MLKFIFLYFKFQYIDVCKFVCENYSQICKFLYILTITKKKQQKTKLHVLKATWMAEQYCNIILSVKKQIWVNILDYL